MSRNGEADVRKVGKLDPSQCAFVKHWFAQDLSNSEMARRLAVNETTIRRVLRQMGLQRRIPAAAKLQLGNVDVTWAEPVVTPSVVPAEVAASEPVATVAPLAPEWIAVMADRKS